MHLEDLSDAQANTSYQGILLRIIVGDELGQIRVCESPVSQPVNLKLAQTWAQADRSRRIESLAVSSSGRDFTHDEVYVATGLANGEVEIRGETGQVLSHLAANCNDAAEEGNSITGLHFISMSVSNDSGRIQLLSCTYAGLVRIHTQPEQPEAQEWPLDLSWQGPPDVLAIAVDESTSSIAFGCKGSELSVWTMKGERTYLGKAAKPNRIGLVDKPWNTALAFLPSSRGKQIIVGTGQHKVRVYNLEQRRPKLSIDFGEAKITALAPQPDGQHCWIADSQGQIGCLDLKLAKVQGMLKGAAGAVRSLSVHPSANIIVSAGLDRYVRLHDLASRKPIARVYLKHHLVKASFAPMYLARPDKVEVPKIPHGDLADDEQPKGRKKLKSHKKRKTSEAGIQGSKKPKETEGKASQTG